MYSNVMYLYGGQWLQFVRKFRVRQVQIVWNTFISMQPGLKHAVRTAKWARMRRTERASRAVATVSERMLFCASVAILLPILLMRNLSFAEARQGIPRQF